MTLKEFFERYYEIICSGNLDDLEPFYHTGAGVMAGAKSQFESMRKQLSFKMTLRNVELLAKRDDLLIVRDVMTIEGEKEGQALDKRSENIHSLAKEGGQWRIFSTSTFPGGAE
ncbi:nuclear transport factor 2 family protein [Pseudoalteromonas sp. R3]|uniref:nuclear transport factor 2 family protein n=1 Tax=Pseudoalteromonas sp. R3 TaxID=1709477 RepID=UPI0006B55146|nr:nuclear transport factor 2 family protein [Pseudoalteromonas sp. R3]AZZ99955.1 nuclear transport factor 2 family protein [Pseudoalteromonas sp. R3]